MSTVKETNKIGCTHTHIHTHTHTQTVEYYSVIKRKEGNAICSNVYRVKDYHTEWSQGKTDIIWYHLYVEPEKKDKWAYLQNRNRFTDIKNKLKLPKENVEVGINWE